jgi:DNA repair protein RecN (Recombination protein N)
MTWPSRRIVLRDFVIVGELDLDLGERLHRTDRRDRRRQVDPDRRPCNWCRRTAPTRHCGCAKAPAAPMSAPNSTCPRQRWLAELAGHAGFDSNDTLLLRRTVDPQGKSRAWINGSPATPRNCASSANSWSTSTASTPGKA